VTTAPVPHRLAGSPGPLAAVHDLALLDLDGVVYVGPAAVPRAVEAVAAITRAGMRVCYVTNNASRPPGTVAEHLVELGIPAVQGDVVTSAQVAAALLARQVPAGAAVLVVGGTGLREAVAEQGLRPVATVADHPVAVVQGFGPDVGWRDLAEGAHAVRSGLPWVATNLDATVPTPAGPAPGNGTLVHAVATAAGRRPDQVAGKPEPAAFLEAVRRYGSSLPIVVGDRLDTDLAGARAAGIPGLAVLTGIAGVTDLLTAPPALRPDHVGRDLGALLETHPPVTLDTATGSAACRRATVTYTGPAGAALAVTLDTATVRTDGEPGDDALDVLRAACVLAWWVADATGRPVDPAPVVAAVLRLDPAAGWAR